MSTNRHHNEEKQKTDKRNIYKLVFSQFLINLGDVLINPKVTLPWLLSSVGAPLFLLGWLVPIRESGSLLPQVLIAHFMYGLKRRKWVWILGSIVQSLCVVVIGIAALVLEGASAGWVIVGTLIVFSIARGLNSVASKDVLGKTVIKSKRGRVTGWASSASGFITVVAASAILFFFDQLQENVNFYIIGIAAATFIWLFAALVYSFIKEPLTEVHEKASSLSAILKEFRLLKNDPVFRRFVIARSLLLCAALSAPYYVLIAQGLTNSSVLTLGIFVLVSGLASLLSSPFWGMFSDYSSRKVMLISSLLSACIGVILFASVRYEFNASIIEWIIPILYFLLSVAHQGIRIGRKTYLINLGEGNKRTSYVAVSNTVIGFILLVMSSVSLLSYALSFEMLVIIFSSITFVGVVMVMRLPET
ncbi:MULTISPECIES: MFS transporter [Marinomonas]|uniref:MFS transporter n=1 Tax=Marinomonas TaxID=28253 RepID=UPI0022437B90|nr:MFS transporter [Marinomonas pontica]MCW8355945.1 MFS transporter [Marinomonas pontica]